MFEYIVYLETTERVLGRSCTQRGMLSNNECPGRVISNSDVELKSTTCPMGVGY